MIVPTCPELTEQDLLLRVRTHPTHQQAEDMNDTWGDTDRLQEIGAQVIHMALTAHFFNSKPVLEAAQIRERVEHVLSPEGPIGDWVTNSNLKNHYVMPDCLTEHTELRKYFETYVGAVWYSHGMAKAHNWIIALVAGEPTIKEEGQVNIPPPAISSPSGSSSQQAEPPQYSAASPTSPTAGANNVVTLAVVNELAVKKRSQLTWQASHTGPPHMPLWEVACLVNGVEQGRASGPSQKVAKEAAGRQAVAAMGWA